jgi:hypothetical protein
MILILRGVAQLIKLWVCFPEIITNSRQTSEPLEAYMVLNFRARGISRGVHKLAQTSTLI